MRRYPHASGDRHVNAYRGTLALGAFVLTVAWFVASTSNIGWDAHDPAVARCRAAFPVEGSGSCPEFGDRREVRCDSRASPLDRLREIFGPTVDARMLTTLISQAAAPVCCGTSRARSRSSRVFGDVARHSVGDKRRHTHRDGPFPPSSRGRAVRFDTVSGAVIDASIGFTAYHTCT